MSVVSGPDFDELKRFNLSEIGMPPASAAEGKDGGLKDEGAAERESIVKTEVKVKADGEATESGMPSVPSADEKDVKKEDEGLAESEGVVKTEVKVEEIEKTA